MIQFDWTVNLGYIGTTVVFLVGLGIYLGKLSAFMKRANEFFKESSDDRASIRKEVAHKHNENVQRFYKMSKIIGRIEETLKANGQWH